jgi:Xaa-Pro aminopeptidase
VRAGAELRPLEANPVDLAWGAARPAQPTAPVVPHDERHAGESSASKRARIGQAIARAGAGAAVLTAPSSIAWLFNVRGGDVIRSPLPLAQAIVEADGRARLFLDPAKVTNDLPGWLGDAVRLEAPSALPAALDALKGCRVLIDPSQSSAWYFDRLEAAGATVVRAMDPCALPRAAKNPVEIEGARQAHIRDGVALARFLHWVDTVAQVELPDERGVVEALERFREETGALKDLSFDTIAGVGPNAALPHYKPVTRTIRRMETGSLDRNMPGSSATWPVLEMRCGPSWTPR